MRRDAGELAAALAGLDAAALRRRRRVVEAWPARGDGTRVIVLGRELRVFCSNDYLGLAHHPALAAAQHAAAERDGSGAGAAHLISGHGREHQALEEELAAFCGRQRALLYSTGYMANLGVLSAFATRGASILQDRLNHASLIDGARLAEARLLRYAHADAGDAARRLERAADCEVVASDGLFSMDGDTAPLAALAEAARRARAWLVVDDAHGLGATGATGRGTLELQGLGAAAVPLLVGTLGKAFGCFGAFVAGDAEPIEWLMQRSRTYVYTTALPPGAAAAARTALRLAASEGWRRERLHSLIARLRAGAAQRGLPLGGSSSPIQPLLVGDAARATRLAAALEARGYWVGAIRPPTVPPGTARLRITLSAAHDEAAVDGLLEALSGAWAAEAARPPAVAAGP
jgi:8-amino-7-oxononanoate synthase